MLKASPHISVDTIERHTNDIGVSALSDDYWDMTTLEVEGVLANRIYDINDMPNSEYDFSIKYLLDEGLIINGVSKHSDAEDIMELQENILVSCLDIPDEKYPYIFNREYTIFSFYDSDLEIKITQRFEPDVLYIAIVDEETIFYNCSDDFTNFPHEKGNLDEIIPYLQSLDSDVNISELLFDYAPFNEYEGKLWIDYYDTPIPDETNDCQYSFVRAYQIWYQFFGQVYSCLLINTFIIKNFDTEEFEMTPIVAEIPNDTIRGCHNQYCLPAPLKLISEFAEEGIDITQMCGSSKALDIVVETNETSDGCYVYYTRHYTVKSECTDRVFAEIDHKFVLPRTLKLNGYLSTLYYEDEAPAEYEDIGTLLSNGVKIEYSGEDSDLTLSSKDFEMDVPNRIRRE